MTTYTATEVSFSDKLYPVGTQVQVCSALVHDGVFFALQVCSALVHDGVFLARFPQGHETWLAAWRVEDAPRRAA
jgi:hypothetical protein